MSVFAALRRRGATLPAGVWLSALVVASVVVRVVLARRIVAPWIMVDEIVYSELAKSFAAHGQFLVRGIPSTGYGVVYPILIAPAWRLFSSIPTAYAAAKDINSVVMSLAAVPAYFLARRLLPVGLALAVATLTVLVPEMLYTGMIMTENVFYPVFIVFALLLVVTLERPSARRQLGLLALLALAYETRAQAVALIPALLTAPVLFSLMRLGGVREGVRRFALVYGVILGGALAAVAETTARGRSPLTLLGAYDAATSSTYTVSGVAHYLLYHVAGLDLYLGIVPFAALLAIWFSPRLGSPARAAFASASLSISVFLVAEVAAFASQPSVLRIEERNMFYLAPFGLIAVLALASEGIVPRRGRAMLAAAVLAAVLPVLIPFNQFITTSSVSDTFAMLPWWWVQDHFISLGQVRYAALAAGILGAALFVLVPRRLAYVPVLLIALYFVATTAVVDNGRHGIHVTAVGSLWAGTHMAEPDWIDRAVGANASVDVLWNGATTPYPVWENEFFNRSVRHVYDLDGAPEPDPLPELSAMRSSSGMLTSAGRPIRAQYVLAPSALRLSGSTVSVDKVGYTLTRVEGPIIVLPLPTISGLYPDTWSGSAVSYSLADCPGGSLAVQLESDASLFKAAQTLVAREAGRVVARIAVGPTQQPTLTLPLMPGAAHRCTVAFSVGRTVVPAQVERGSTDPRHLGLHFLSFIFTPAP